MLHTPDPNSHECGVRLPERGNWGVYGGESRFDSTVRQISSTKRAEALLKINPHEGNWKKDKINKNEVNTFVSLGLSDPSVAILVYLTPVEISPAALRCQSEMFFGTAANESAVL